MTSDQEPDEEMGDRFDVGTPWHASTWEAWGVCRCGGPLPPQSLWHNPGNDWSHITCPACGWLFVDEEEFICGYSPEVLAELADGDDHESCLIPTWVAGPVQGGGA